MKRDTSTLIQFLETGELGQIKIGMMLEAVQNYLGEPGKLVHTRKSDGRLEIGLIRYGCLDLIIENNQITAIDIFIERYPEYTLPAPIPDNWMPALYQMPAQELSHFLDNRGFRQDDYARFGTIELYDMNITFWFTPDNHLQSIWHR